MVDVFISYARPDESLAISVADSLREANYSVWRDDELPAHEAYADVIRERLLSAKAVVVLWSAEAAKSQWVRSEADAARHAGTLVQATIDGITPPMPFDQIQYANLTGWPGNRGSAGWDKLAASVVALAGENSVRSRATKTGRNGPSICVLPFANMSGDAEQQYFSDGISEDITTDLSKIASLAVTARNTAFTYKGDAVNVCEVAHKLGVSHVLEGSVRKAGSRVRVTAQLIDGGTGDHVWADRYDRELTDIFAIQDEISKAIVQALRLKLLPGELKAIEQKGTANVEAYNAYLMARQCWITGDLGDLRREKRVIRICQRAIALDPNYAEAWALMGLAQSSLFNDDIGGEDLDDGLAASARALALDPSIAQAHLPMAWHLVMHGRMDKAEAELQAALAIDPTSWEVHKEAARIFYRARRFEDARGMLEQAVELAEADFHSRGMLVGAYLGGGDVERAKACAAVMLKDVDEALAREPDNTAAMAYAALSHAAAGHADTAREWTRRVMKLKPENAYVRFNLAWITLGFLEDREAAMDLLEPALAKAGRSLVNLIAADRNLDELHGDPRFETMLAAAKARLAAERA